MGDNPASAGPETLPDIWQDGDTVVMRAGARLPDRCIKCNVPVAEPAVRVRLFPKPSSIWKPERGRGFEIDPNNLLADWAVVRIVTTALFVKVPAIEVKLCARHRTIERAKLIVVSAATLFAAGYEIRAFLLYGRGALNLHTIAASVLVGCAFIFSRTVRAEDNRSDPLRLHGMCEAFRRDLPNCEKS